jgi:hypothetical protein
MEDRREIEDAFERGDLAGVALSTPAAQTAITLVRGWRVIEVDLDWTPSGNEQLEARCFRLGQKRRVLYTRLVAAHAVDRRLYELLTHKTEVNDAAIKAASVGDVDVDPAAAWSLPAEVRRLAGAPKSPPPTAPAPVAPEPAGELPGAPGELFGGWHVEALPGAPASSPGAPGGRLDGGSGGSGSPSDDAPRYDPPPGRARRGPATEAERWTLAALLTLSGLDGDRARERNDVGWNQQDGELGHELAQLAASGGLTDGQWSLAMRRCRKYHRQVGACPEPTK